MWLSCFIFSAIDGVDFVHWRRVRICFFFVGKAIEKNESIESNRLFFGFE